MPAHRMPKVAGAVQEILDNPMMSAKAVAERHGCSPASVRRILKQMRDNGDRRVLQKNSCNVVKRVSKDFMFKKVKMKHTDVGPVALDDPEYLADVENSGKVSRANASPERNRRRASNDKFFRQKFRAAFRQAQDWHRDENVGLSCTSVCRSASQTAKSFSIHTAHFSDHWSLANYAHTCVFCSSYHDWQTCRTRAQLAAGSHKCRSRRPVCSVRTNTGPNEAWKVQEPKARTTDSCGCSK